MDGELFLLEDYVDDTPPDFISENGEEPPRKILRRRKVTMLLIFESLTVFSLLFKS